MYSTKIKSIKRIGIIDTYDIHTPKYHNFFLNNGILSHNSGKSYRDLRKIELWYLYKFNEKVPPQNICFTISEVIKLLNSGNLRKGELIIFEEAGANMGSLDFQNKMQKMFTYVMQSFRSMNIGIMFNLPYVSMLNKQIRMLLHYRFESAGVDYKNKINKCKPFFRQVNQNSGKIYEKYMRARVNGKTTKIKRFNFSVPSKYLIDIYETKKQKFVTDLTKDFEDKLDKEEIDNQRKMARNDLTELQQEAFEDWQQGLLLRESAEKRGKSIQNMCDLRQACRKKGFSVSKSRKSLGNSTKSTLKPLQIAHN